MGKDQGHGRSRTCGRKPSLMQFMCSYVVLVKCILIMEFTYASLFPPLHLPTPPQPPQTVGATQFSCCHDNNNKYTNNNIDSFKATWWWNHKYQWTQIKDKKKHVCLICSKFTKGLETWTCPLATCSITESSSKKESFDLPNSFAIKEDCGDSKFSWRDRKCWSFGKCFILFTRFNILNSMFFTIPLKCMKLKIRIALTSNI